MVTNLNSGSSGSHVSVYKYYLQHDENKHFKSPSVFKSISHQSQSNTFIYFDNGNPSLLVKYASVVRMALRAYAFSTDSSRIFSLMPFLKWLSAKIFSYLAKTSSISQGKMYTSLYIPGLMNVRQKRIGETIISQLTTHTTYNIS